jgi:hypothetical protein
MAERSIYSSKSWGIIMLTIWVIGMVATWIVGSIRMGQGLAEHGSVAWPLIMVRAGISFSN